MNQIGHKKAQLARFIHGLFKARKIDRAQALDLICEKGVVKN